MANTAKKIPFYVAKDGAPLTGASAEMAFEYLMTLGAIDKSGSAPAIVEIGGGWYYFAAAYLTAPFDAGDLVGVIDADKDGTNSLSDAERYIPIEVRLDFYALMQLVGKMSQVKDTGNITLLDDDDNPILVQQITDGNTELTREPGQYEEA